MLNSINDSHFVKFFGEKELKINYFKMVVSLENYLNKL